MNYRTPIRLVSLDVGGVLGQASAGLSPTTRPTLPRPRAGPTSCVLDH